MSKKNVCRLSLEQLEYRELPTGGFLPPLPPVVPPMVQVMNLPERPLNILPGATNRVIADMTINTTNRSYARLTEMLLVPAVGSEVLWPNTIGMRLLADLNGDSRDGCETPIAAARANYQTDVVDFRTFYPAWARPNRLIHLQVVAYFGSHFTGDKIGVELAQAFFADLRNTPVPNSHVAYGGASPTLHHLKSAALLVVSQNSAYLNQTVAPNTTNVKIGSYVLQNLGTSEAIRISSLSIATTVAGTTFSNFSGLKTSDTTGSGSQAIQPTGNDVFSVNDILQSGQSMVLDIFTDTGPDISGTIATMLTVSSIGVVDNIPATVGPITGQTLTLSIGHLSRPTIVTALTTPSQSIAVGSSGAVNASQATYNFVSVGGALTITALKFTVTNNAVTNICVGTVCAAPVNGIAYLTGLNLAVPNGGAGLMMAVFVSYASVGIGGLPPGTTATIALSWVKFTTGATTGTMDSTPPVTAPTMTLI